MVPFLPTFFVSREERKLLEHVEQLDDELPTPLLLPDPIRPRR